VYFGKLALEEFIGNMYGVKISKAVLGPVGIAIVNTAVARDTAITLQAHNTVMSQPGMTVDSAQYAPSMTTTKGGIAGQTIPGKIWNYVTKK
jgi:hypothetical protein